MLSHKNKLQNQDKNKTKKNKFIILDDDALEIQSNDKKIENKSKTNKYVIVKDIESETELKFENKKKIQNNKYTIVDDNNSSQSEEDKNKLKEVISDKKPLSRKIKANVKVIILEDTDSEESEEKTIQNKFYSTEDNAGKNDLSISSHNKIIVDLDKMISEVENKYNPDENHLKKEKLEYDYLKLNATSSRKEYEPYPTLNDPNFAIKIAKRKEFFHTRYDGTIYGVKDRSDTLCQLQEFELMPNQLFVKNFMSLNTPYNSLLLYFGLGTGKTCAAIGVAEEMRSYMKQIGINAKNKIFIIASPNVQDNFRLQLFDKAKLKKVNHLAEDSLWNIESCIGNSLLKEINPMNLKGLSREKVISQIESIIKSTYEFMGYVQLLNYIQDYVFIRTSNNQSKHEKEQQEIKNIHRYFDNQLIIIDEVHNIHLNEDNAQNKKVANFLMRIARYANNLRFVLLSATPMYNSYKEIIWITNLMNINDGRATIEIGDVFDKVGDFIPSDKKTGKEGGKELIERKLTGYVSYIRGENPYLFPFRVYPDKFAKNQTFAIKHYPELQMNRKRITAPLRYIKVYLNSIGEYQKEVYKYVLYSLKRRLASGAGGEDAFAKMASFGYVILQIPLQALNIVFPNQHIDKLLKEHKTRNVDNNASDVAISDIIFDEDFTPEEEYDEDVITSATSSLPQEIEYSKEELSAFGTTGLKNIMDYEEKRKPFPQMLNFEYKKTTTSIYGRIFDEEHLSKYSDKIARICNCVKNSTGIVLIYSQYIYCGVLPIALALEEMGFSRHSFNNNFKNLFKTRNGKDKIKTVDALTMQMRDEVVGNNEEFFPAKYVMITGDKAFSPSNAEDIRYATDLNNKDGSRVKVILISKAGSEGLDFKFIRQIHVLEPWYNMNRLEQIIGRGVRSMSHCALPFEKRNVEIYLHATLIEEKHNIFSSSSSEETADLYIYRLAEKKAIKIGKITRILKETSVDCILNIEQTNFTVIKMQYIAENKNVKIDLSSGLKIDFRVGDQPMTEMCDYMESCEYKCNGNLSIVKKEQDTIRETYDVDYIKTNYQQIVEKIRKLFREHAFYKRAILVNSINLIKHYPIEQIYYALTYLIENKHEYLIDKYGRLGNLINTDEYYIFQPFEISDTSASIYERTTPVDYKRTSILLEPLTKFGKSPNNSSEDKTPLNRSPIFDEKTYSIKKSKELKSESSHKIRENNSRTSQNIIDEMVNNYNIVFEEKRAIIEHREKDWYKHANLVKKHLLNVHRVPIILFKKYIVYHLLDLMSYDDKVILLHDITNISTGTFIFSREKGDAYFSKSIVDYYTERLLYDEKTKTTGFILNMNDSRFQIFVLNKIPNEDGGGENNIYVWNIMQNLDIPIFSNHIDKKLDVDVNNIGNMIGFIDLFKKQYSVFRIKEMVSRSNNRGAVCGNSTVKSEAIKVINKFVGNKMYNENDKDILLQGICIIIETLMRYYTEIQKDNKIYFFNPEQSNKNKISQLNFPQ